MPAMPPSCPGAPSRTCSGRSPSLTSLRASISCSSSGRAQHLGRERDVDVLPAEAPAAVARLERAVDQVHRRRAEEGGDEDVGGAPVDVLRRADLLQHALAHHGDPVPHRHRLDLVVRDVHRRDPEPRVQLDQLEPRLDAQLRVEVRERLVHQERVRLAHDRARERDALPLPARELPRVAGAAARRARGSRRRGGRPARSRSFGFLAIWSGNAMFLNTVMCG